MATKIYFGLARYSTVVHNPTLVPRGFSRSWTSVRWRGRWRENLWAHTSGPIQSETVLRISESKSDSETSITASDWIDVFKGLNVCTQRFPHISILHLTLIREWESLWVPGTNYKSIDFLHVRQTDRFICTMIKLRSCTCTCINQKTMVEKYYIQGTYSL